MTRLSVREINRHLEAAIPFVFPHETQSDDGLQYDWEDYLFEESYEEAHGWYDDYDPFEYAVEDPYPLCDDFYD